MKRLWIIIAVALLAAASTATGARHWIITSRSQIKPTVLRTFHGPRGPAGPQGPAGAQGPAGTQSPLSALTTVIAPAVAVTPGTVGQSVATCPAGSHAISGGGFGSISGIDVTEMSSDHQSWILLITNTTQITEKVQAEAYCAAAGQAVAADAGLAHARAIRQASRLAARLRVAAAAAG